MDNTKTQETTFNTPPEATQLDIEQGDASFQEEKKENLDEIESTQSIPPDQLLVALYYVWDAFDRCNVPYFLVNQTAEDAIAGRNLTGNCIEIGIRRTEWISGGRRLIDNFLGLPVEESPTLATYKHEGVPILLYNYEDHECIVQTDMIHYAHEEFKVPNPYSAFKEIYG